MIPITGLYIGLTVLLAGILGMRVGLYRGVKRISILHGDDMELATRMRAHGNLLETAALTLLAMAAIELGGASPTLLHGLGVAFILARIAHPLGLKADDVTPPLRAIGAMLSTLVMLTAGGVAIWQYASKTLG